MGRKEERAGLTKSLEKEERRKRRKKAKTRRLARSGLEETRLRFDGESVIPRNADARIVTPRAQAALIARDNR